jgi:hypothetical protein
LGDASDLDALVGLGPIAEGIPRVDATELYDLNGDDLIDLGDVDEFLEMAADKNGFDDTYDYGDANLDGVVNATDLNALAVAWQSPSLSWSAGNFNGDGIVDVSDLNQLAVHWQNRIAAAAPVPEPGGFAGLGCILLAVLSHRESGRRRAR